MKRLLLPLLAALALPTPVSALLPFYLQSFSDGSSYTFWKDNMRCKGPIKERNYMHNYYYSIIDYYECKATFVERDLLGRASIKTIGFTCYYNSPRRKRKDKEYAKSNSFEFCDVANYFGFFSYRNLPPHPLEGVAPSKRYGINQNLP